MEKNQFIPEIQRIIDEANKLKGDYEFKLTHSRMLSDTTVGNTASCTNIGGCEPGTSSSCG